jgi:hypothetical protein
MEAKADPKTASAGSARQTGTWKHPGWVDLREELYRATGVDLTAIDALNVLT